ncbi:MAG: hypothetical protein ACF8XB_07750 [Planctomycetota bacterium JB042]
MKLKRKIESLEDVDEKYRALYVEADDGGFELESDLLPSGDGEDVEGLREAVRRERRDKRKAQADAREARKFLERHEAESFEDLDDVIETARSGGGDGKADPDAIRTAVADAEKRLGKAHDEKLAELASKIEKQEGALRKNLRSSLKAAALEAGVSKGMIEVFVDAHMQHVGFNDDFSPVWLDSDGSPRIGKGGADAGIEELIASRSGDEAYLGFFEGNGRTGPGAPQGGSPNARKGSRAGIDPSFIVGTAADGKPIIAARIGWQKYAEQINGDLAYLQGCAPGDNVTAGAQAAPAGGGGSAGDFGG